MCPCASRGASGQQIADALRVGDGVGRVLESVGRGGDARRGDAQFADGCRAGKGQQAGLDGDHGHGFVGAECVLVDCAAVAVESAGAVERKDVGAVSTASRGLCE